MEHKFFKCKCNQFGCSFCSGGLLSCTVCKGGEGTLTTECCGRPITDEEENSVYKEHSLDFIGGKWVDIVIPTTVAEAVEIVYKPLNEAFKKRLC